MPKTIKNVFSTKLEYIYFYEAHYRAVTNKRHKDEVILFEMDLETNLSNLVESIKNGTYQIGKYREFIIYEPKKRIIKSLPYRDRIVHQWYVEEFIKPYFLPRFIKDTCACIENRGTHYAADMVQKYMRIMKRNIGDYYILKCDVKKYFYSIDKNILFEIMSRKISDQELLEFTKKIIFDGTGDVGIPIGNYTSQYFANIYLNELDHYVKEDLKIKYYVRYMDDFILLLRTKEEAKEVLEKISYFLREKLKLELNQKTRYYPNKMGCNFCGYVIYETHMLLRKRSKKHIKRQIKKWNRSYLEGNLNLHKAILEWNAWCNHASHANSYNLRIKMYDQILFKEFLKNPKTENKMLTKKG